MIFCASFSVPPLMLIGAYFLEVFYQEQVAKRVKSSLTRITEPSALVVLRRPYHISWFATQVATCACTFFIVILPS